MSSKNHRPKLEALETRAVFSVTTPGLPADTLGVARGSIIGAGGSGSAAVTVAADNLAQGRSSTVIGVAVTPETTDGASGALRPRIVSVFGPDGQRLPFYQQGSLGAKLGGPATMLVLDSQPGPITVNVVGKGHTAGAFQLRVYLPGDVDGSGHVDNADLQAILPAYLSQIGDKNYNPAADPLQTGKIGQQSVRLLERNLSDPTPNRVLGLIANLSPPPTRQSPHLYNSGPITAQRGMLTVVGQTLPNSAIFVDGYYGLYNFNGPLVTTDTHGNFSYTFQPRGKLDATVDFLVVTPDGRQLIRNFPILRVGANNTGSGNASG